MLSSTLATLRSGIFYVIGRCSTGNESVLVFDFGILHRDEALVARRIFSTESGFAISPSAIPIKDHTDSVDGMCRSFCQLLNLVGLQEQSRSFRDWYSLHPRFDDRTSELALEVVKVAVLKFRQFARRAYLTLGECRIRQDSDYKNARYDRGIVSPFVDYGESNFKRLVYVEGVGRSNQSNISHNQVRAELQTDLLPEDAS